MELNNLICAYVIPCVQEVVTPFYIVSYYIKWGNYFLDTWYVSWYSSWLCPNTWLMKMLMVTVLRSRMESTTHNTSSSSPFSLVVVQMEKYTSKAGLVPKWNNIFSCWIFCVTGIQLTTDHCYISLSLGKRHQKG